MNAALFPRPKISVVIPTRNRPDRLRRTVAGLRAQEGLDPTEYELIVVDDGSAPPAAVEPEGKVPALVAKRLGGEGRSAARNSGVDSARGELVVFVDDDMQVTPGFLAAHWQAHLDWPGCLQVGSVRLTAPVVRTPFGRFRQRLEDEAVPSAPGPSASPGFCTAQNMAMERDSFTRLGGFNPRLSVAEDQDLALRYAHQGGRIAFVSAAVAVHDDDGGLDFDAYCDRAERYMEELVPFGAQHPEWPDTVVRERVNGPIRWGKEPAGVSAKKILKTILIWGPVHFVALRIVSFVERVAPDGGLLDRLYRVMLGAHLQRGYRRGLRSARG